MTTVGVRREDKSIWERRVPLTPAVARLLRDQHGIETYIQPSSIRAFSDDEFRQAGVQVDEDLSGCPVVLAIKEIPKNVFLPGQAYVFFAHVIKGQPFNMPMLARLLELGCTLIDYERITDDTGRRLIFFGWHAGVAGMLETLRALGLRLQWQGVPNPFAALRQPYQYRDLDEALLDVDAAAASIRTDGLPASLAPLTLGVAGYGNVARGVWHILDRLPVQVIEPDDLAGVAVDPAASRHVIYAATFREEHIAASLAAGQPFDLQRYYQHPEEFQPAFEPYLPYLDVLVNAIYWTPQYPRLVTKTYLRDAMAGDALRLQVIGDISCDIDGAIECTVRATEAGEPCFVYDPLTDETTDGVAGRGVVDMAVDILPSELPRDASEDFSRVLAEFIPALATADYSAPFAELALPAPIKRAVITHRGELTPDYRYLLQYL
ncbi:MAG: hypothetical protein KDI55_12575 [Anaerolineae bacterium]|nr:hypothetical protein [Anaerolineae bacterium]